MARYIDADDLKAVIKANDWSNPVVPDVVCVIIDRSPTADVIEKQAIADRLEVVITARKQVAQEIFSELEFDVRQLSYLPAARRGEAIENIIANLKNKYTKGE